MVNHPHSSKDIEDSKRWTLLVLVLLILAGCQIPARSPPVPFAKSLSRYKTIKPVVAVMDFENLSGFHGRWELGEGMADLLTAELLRRGRFSVLERQHLEDVVQDILLQEQGLFRKEGRVKKGRLKNAKYLIRGSVTEFTVAKDLSGWFGSTHLKAFGRGTRARVVMYIRVYHVETGEILFSVRSDSSANAGGLRADVRYDKLSFGADAFFRTPLGRATMHAVRKAVKKIAKQLPAELWEPRVAESGPDTVVINGGENVGVRPGDLFIVREIGRSIHDPVSGNIIEVVPGRVVGKIRVVRVTPLSAHAVVLDGTAGLNQPLEPVKELR